MSAETVRNHYRRQGAEAEQKRILKLLETKTHETCRNQPPLELDGSPAPCLFFHEGCTVMLRHIALIRGEEQ